MRKEDEHTAAFLRMAAIELRRLAEVSPEIAPALRHIAEKLDAEVGDIERRANLGR